VNTAGSGDRLSAVRAPGRVDMQMMRAEKQLGSSIRSMLTRRVKRGSCSDQPCGGRNKRKCAARGSTTVCRSCGMARDRGLTARAMCAPWRIGGHSKHGGVIMAMGDRPYGRILYGANTSLISRLDRNASLWPVLSASRRAGNTGLQSLWPGHCLAIPGFWVGLKDHEKDTV